jgi:parallel beta-helix repeat protein
MHRKAQILLSLAATAVALAIPASASADVSCDLAVAPGASATAAIEGLNAGETLCFHGGTYQFDTVSVRAPDVTVTSFPGEEATLRGQVRVERPASGATLEGLILDGRNPNDEFSPLIYADRTVLRGNDISDSHTSNCVHLSTYYDEPAPRDVLIEGNRIHDCGRLPATNHDHGIYVASSRNLIIRDNLIYGNADRGIQLFPDAQGTLIEGNVIDGNGQGIIFSGYEGVSSSDTTVVHNIITNSNLRHNVESFYPEDTPAGRNNVVRENCIFNADDWYDEADGSGIQFPQEGFDATNNIIADPEYVDRADGNFDLKPGSPCAGVLEGTGIEQLSLEAVKPTVKTGQRTTLRGDMPVALDAQVWIFKKRHGNWKSFKRASLHGTRFSAKVRIHSRSHFKARAAGVRDSNAVAVVARRGKH